MPRKAKLSITDRGHARAPDFSIPAPGAKHYDAAAQHYEEAARHQRQAAKLYRAGDSEKANHHAHLAHAHQLSGVQHAEDAAKDLLRNHRDDSREGKECPQC